MDLQVFEETDAPEPQTFFFERKKSDSYYRCLMFFKRKQERRPIVYFQPIISVFLGIQKTSAYFCTAQRTLQTRTVLIGRLSFNGYIIMLIE